jgi:hypothetical protein
LNRPLLPLLALALLVGGARPVGPAGVDLPSSGIAPVPTVAPGALTEPRQAPGPVAGEPRDSLRVFLLTMDQGDEVWEKFGHNALLVRNEATGEEVAWNWGLFNFEDVDFIPRFLRGTMRYSMGGFPPDLMLREYIRADRSVYANEVRLTQEQARELDVFVRWNALEENRHYVYDYFRDNCSTRVRDVLDRVLDGRLQVHFQDRMTPRSYRWHTRRLVQGTAWIDQGLSFLLGSRGDLPRSDWEAMFIPMIMMELLEGFHLPAPAEAGEADGSLPLLGPREVIHQASRPPAPEEPPSFSVWFLVAGLGGAGVLVGLTARITAAPSTGRREPRRISRSLLVAAILGWSLSAGALGILLVAAWFTDHTFIQWNLNLFHLSPLALPLGVLLVPGAVSPARARGRTGQIARSLAALVAGLSLLVALLQLVQLLHQGNAEVVAVAVPVNLALVWVAMRLYRSEPPTHSAA